MKNKASMFILAAIILVLSIGTLCAAPFRSYPGIVYDQDILSINEDSDTQYQPLPFFDNDDTYNNYAGAYGRQYFSDDDFRTSTYSYVAVGAGWGR